MDLKMEGEDNMVSEPRVARATPSRATPLGAGLAALAERVTRVETTMEHLQETLSRIDANLDKMQQKIDTLANSMALGIGGLRVGRGGGTGGGGHRRLRGRAVLAGGEVGKQGSAGKGPTAL